MSGDASGYQCVNQTGCSDHTRPHGCGLGGCKDRNKDRPTIQSEALKACIDVYMNIHVSELHKFTECVKTCWKIGQEWYNCHKD